MSGSKRSNRGRVTNEIKKHKKNQHPEYEGLAQMTRDGNLFVKVEELEDDVFISAAKARGALNGDRVRIALTRPRVGNKHADGTVIDILERTKRPFVGVLHIVGAQAWVIMQSKFMPYDIVVDIVDPKGTPAFRHKTSQQTTERRELKGALRQLGNNEYAVTGVYETVDGEARELRAHVGMKVAVVVDSWVRGERYPHGQIVDVLGELGDNNTEMHAILAEYGLPYRFEPDVEKAADAISDAITPKDLKGRRDFRDTLTFTIDPADAKDFDDALSYKKQADGNLEIGIHIADVSYYVRPGSAVDKEAQARGTSVYLVDRTVPMLPEKLSNKLCSLRPHEDKLTFSAVFTMTPQGKVLDRWFGRTVIDSDHRFNYEEAQEIIDGKGDGGAPKEIGAAILDLWKIASLLRHRRFAAGAISFERPEMKVECDENGKPLSVRQFISKEANWLIEEFMLLANRSVAEYVATDGKMDGKERKTAKTFVYRIHDLPNMEKLGGLSEFASGFGYKVQFGEGEKISAKLNGLLADAKDKPEFMALEMIALRAMAKAAYSTDNIGHYGLAFKFYTHFTSPIRRYPDLMVHRLLAQYLDNGASQNKDYFQEQCVHASEREVIAANAERDSIKYKLVEFMQDKIGLEFDGHVSGVTDWGMYVEIEPTKIEGMVSLREIRSDFFEFDEKGYCLRGRRTGRVFRLGDPVRIRVKMTSLEQRLLDYELVEEGFEKAGRDGSGFTGRDAQSAKYFDSRSQSPFFDDETGYSDRDIEADPYLHGGSRRGSARKGGAGSRTGASSRAGAGREEAAARPGNKAARKAKVKEAIKAAKKKSGKGLRKK